MAHVLASEETDRALRDGASLRWRAGRWTGRIVALALPVAVLLLVATALGAQTMALAPRLDAYVADGRVARVPLGTPIALSNIEIGWEARLEGGQLSVLTPLPEVPFFGFPLEPFLDSRLEGLRGSFLAIVALLVLAFLGRRRGEARLLAVAGLLVGPRLLLGALPDVLAPAGWIATPALVAALVPSAGRNRLLALLGVGGSVALAVPGIGTWAGLVVYPLPLRDDLPWAPAWIGAGIVLLALLPGALATARLAALRGDRRSLPVRLATALIPGGGALRLALAERERSELADEIHNEVLPELGVAISRVEASDREAAAALRVAEERLRTLMNERRNVALEATGLGPALDDLCRRFDDRVAEGIERSIELPERPPRYVELAALRVAEAAVANAVAHAAARRVVVEVAGDARSLLVAVRDDGRGFAETLAARAAERGHLGLHGMREWAAAIGATLAIETAPGAGTRIELRWPAA